ncbi:heavy metal-binding domain-containing protein [Ferrimonas aestuarii]|uniref:Heavy metal binding domain-containing protein n=1 Tax=Ferrimonas aestuarii TaxID=2569539 RepID=A0A4V5NWA8_9GAMM|nr:heavy metal-binding domain-containing protein [Ferrimonas aestuarii]TKB56266.1 hypothetical protein FCL42_08635 [Ferrimonas aestuarii]
MKKLLAILAMSIALVSAPFVMAGHHHDHNGQTEQHCPHAKEGKCDGSCKMKMKDHHGHHHGDAAAGEEYTHACPMNPKIKGHAGDTCPKCGMDLEPMKSEQKAEGYTHACPMNPKIQGYAGDTCPKCGMDLEPMADAGHGHGHKH